MSPWWSTWPDCCSRGVATKKNTKNQKPARELKLFGTTQFFRHRSSTFLSSFNRRPPRHYTTLNRPIVAMMLPSHRGNWYKSHRGCMGTSILHAPSMRLLRKVPPPCSHIRNKSHLIVIDPSTMGMVTPSSSPPPALDILSLFLSASSNPPPTVVHHQRVRQ